MIDAVAALLREVADAAILPRYRTLAEGDVEEKAPGELVTIADREAEAMLTPRLAALRRGSRVIGEEACAADPALIATIGDGLVWIVDPIDGTANFCAGTPPFGTMVALLRDGETIAGWIYDPLTGRLAAAEVGAGAWLGGVRVSTDQASPGVAGLRGAIGKLFAPEEHDRLTRRGVAFGAFVPSSRCAADDYPAIVEGRNDFALFKRSLAWDHAPGALFLTEAGGRAARPDGTDYRPAVAGEGLLIARNATVWEEARSTLFRSS